MGNTKEEKITINGEVVEVLPDTKFRVELTNNQSILCYLGGKMRVHYIKLTEGDWVTVEFSPYDLTIGRIVRRLDGPDAKRLSREKEARLREEENTSNES